MTDIETLMQWLDSETKRSKRIERWINDLHLARKFFGGSIEVCIIKRGTCDESPRNAEFEISYALKDRALYDTMIDAAVGICEQQLTESRLKVEEYRTKLKAAL